MPRMMHIKIMSIVKFLVDRNCTKQDIDSSAKLRTLCQSLPLSFSSGIQEYQLVTWLTVCFSLTLVLLISILALSTFTYHVHNSIAAFHKREQLTN